MARPPKPSGVATPVNPGKVDDAVFLHDEFGIDETVAADLITEEPIGGEAVVDALGRRERAKDPLSDIPTPAEPPSDRIADNDEERLKPVLHQRNDRVGGG
jgi:hypothetical protein